jgi:hypothetical protein
MPIRELCDELGWDITTLSRMANINYRSARKAYEGREISNRIKRNICAAFSAAFGREIRPGDIQWEP